MSSSSSINTQSSSSVYSTSSSSSSSFTSSNEGIIRWEICPICREITKDGKPIYNNNTLALLVGNEIVGYDSQKNLFICIEKTCGHVCCKKCFSEWLNATSRHQCCVCNQNFSRIVDLSSSSQTTNKADCLAKKELLIKLEDFTFNISDIGKIASIIGNLSQAEKEKFKNSLLTNKDTNKVNILFQKLKKTFNECIEKNMLLEASVIARIIPLPSFEEIIMSSFVTDYISYRPDVDSPFSRRIACKCPIEYSLLREFFEKNANISTFLQNIFNNSFFQEDDKFKNVCIFWALHFYVKKNLIRNPDPKNLEIFMKILKNLSSKSEKIYDFLKNVLLSALSDDTSLQNERLSFFTNYFLENAKDQNFLAISISLAREIFNKKIREGFFEAIYNKSLNLKMDPKTIFEDLEWRLFCRVTEARYFVKIKDFKSVKEILLKSFTREYNLNCIPLMVDIAEIYTQINMFDEAIAILTLLKNASTIQYSGLSQSYFTWRITSLKMQSFARKWLLPAVPKALALLNSYLIASYINENYVS